MAGDVPSFTQFNPNLVPWQIKALQDWLDEQRAQSQIEVLTP